MEVYLVFSFLLILISIEFVSSQGVSQSAVLSTANCAAPLSLRIDPYTGQLLIPCFGYTGASLPSLNAVALDPKNNFTQQILLHSSVCHNPLDTLRSSHQPVWYVSCVNTGEGVYAVNVNTLVATQLTNHNTCNYPYYLLEWNNSILVSCTFDLVFAVQMISYNSANNNLSVTGILNATDCSWAFHMAIDPYTNNLYTVCYATSVIAVINLVDNTQKGLINIGTMCGGPWAIEFYNLTRSMLITCYNTGGIISISTVNFAVTNILSPYDCVQARSVRVNPSNNYLYAACSIGGIIQKDMSNPNSAVSVLATATQCPIPGCVQYNPNNTNLVYGCCHHGNTVIAFTTCPAGFYCPPDSIQPTPCPEGFFCPTAGLNTVGPSCPMGYLCPQQSIEPLPCPIGSFCHNGVSTPCYAGSFQNQTTQTFCYSCGVGKYAPSTNYSSCLNCSSGSYSFITGGVQCISCIPGRYSAQTATTCVDCPNNTISSVASASCQTCLSGSYTSGPASSVCLKCPSAAYYCPVNSTQAGYLTVPPGYYSLGGDNTGASANNITACNKGSSCIGGVSTLCPAGSFSNTTQSSFCHQCKAGYYLDLPGKTVCSPCAPGSYYASSASTQCLSCIPGRFSSSAAFTCIDCPNNTISGSSASSCTLCGAGFYTATSASSICLKCPASAYYCPNNSSLLGYLNVPLGFYSIGGDPRGAQANDITACTLGNYCIGGISSPCPLGSFSNVTKSTTCYQCLPGSYQSIAGRSNCSLCPRGFYAPVPGSTQCLSCNAGKFVSSDRTNCIDCPNNTVSASSASSCVSCDAGSYTTGPGSSVCLQCPSAAYYCPTNSSQAGFIKVPRGYHSVGGDSSSGGAGAMNISACQKGSYCVGGVTNSCNFGFYSNATLSTFCYECEAGYYQNQQGSSFCHSCSGGSFTPFTASRQCLICPKGTFSSDPAASGCSICSPGSYSPANSTSCLPCSIGQFQASPGQDQCLPCFSGTIANVTGSSACEACAVGKYSGGLNAATGSAQCVECLPGTYASLPGSVICSPCASQHYSSNFGSAYCDLCLPPLAISANSSSCSEISYLIQAEPALTSSTPFQGISGVVMAFLAGLVILSIIYVFKSSNEAADKGNQNDKKSCFSIMKSFLLNRSLDTLQLIGLIFMFIGIYFFTAAYSSAQNSNDNSSGNYSSFRSSTLDLKCSLFLYFYSLGFVVHHACLYSNTRAIMGILNDKGDFHTILQRAFYPAYGYVAFYLLFQVILLVIWNVMSSFQSSLVSLEETKENDLSQVLVKQYNTCNSKQVIFPVVQFGFAFVFCSYSFYYGLTQLMHLKSKLRSTNPGQDVLSFKTQFAGFLPIIVLVLAEIINLLLLATVLIITLQSTQQYVQMFPVIVPVATFIYTLIYILLYIISHYTEYQYVLTSIISQQPSQDGRKTVFDSKGGTDNNMKSRRKGSTEMKSRNTIAYSTSHNPNLPDEQLNHLSAKTIPARQTIGSVFLSPHDTSNAASYQENFTSIPYEERSNTAKHHSPPPLPPAAHYDAQSYDAQSYDESTQSSDIFQA
jgi:hypothetical protein